MRKGDGLLLTICWHILKPPGGKLHSFLWGTVKMLVKVCTFDQCFSVTVGVIILTFTLRKFFLISTLNPFCGLNFKPVPSCLVLNERTNSCFPLCPWQVSRKQTCCQVSPRPLSVLPCCLNGAEPFAFAQGPACRIGLLSFVFSSLNVPDRKPVPLTEDSDGGPSRDQHRDDLTCPQATHSYLYTQDSVCTTLSADSWPND